MQNLNERAEPLTKAKSVVILTPDRQIDRRILLQAETLATSGWTVTVLAMRPDNDVVNDEPYVVRVGNLMRSDGQPKTSASLMIYSFLRSILPRNNAAVKFTKKLIGQYLIDWEQFYLKIFLQDASSYSPDVFIAADLPMLPVASRSAAKCGAKLIYDSHELYSEQGFSERERRYWFELEKRHIQACDAVITVNESIAQILLQSYLLPKVDVILNATKSGLSGPVKTKLLHNVFRLSKNKKILLFQGSLLPRRNIETIIDAMQLVADKDIVLVILGDGPVKQALVDRVRDRHLTEQVYFHDAVPQEALSRYTAAADGGIIPYQGFCLNNYYCTPNKLFEFISAGVPILGNALPEITKIVTTNNIGLIGAMDTPLETSRLIEHFFSSPSQIVKWRTSLMDVRHTTCWENEGLKFLKIVERVYGDVRRTPNSPAQLSG